MNKIKHINNLLKEENLDYYIHSIENSNISPPADLKKKILNKCYSYNDAKSYRSKIKFIDALKVACFTLIITICTELCMNASYEAKETNISLNTRENIYKITDKLDKISRKISDYILDFNLKGEK